MARDSWRDSAARGGGDPFPDDDSTESSGPIDIMAVRHDDALIDAIAGDGAVATSDADEYRLAGLLAEWRSDILSAPLPERPDLDEVAAAIDLALAEDALQRRRGRNKMRLLRPVVGAAAAVAFLAGGVTAVSYSAVPGDPLWKVKEVVFTQQADSTVAQVDTTSALEDVETALARGDAEVAKARLADAAQRTDRILDADERAQLEMWWTRLSDELARLTAPAPVPPPAATTTAPTSPTSIPAPQDLLPQAPPTGQSIPLPNFELPPGLPELPSSIDLPFPIPTELQLPPAPTTAAEDPTEIMRAPVETAPPAVTPSTQPEAGTSGN